MKRHYRFATVLPAFLLLVLVLAVPGLAMGQQAPGQRTFAGPYFNQNAVCGAHQEIVDSLKTRYAENRVSSGLASNGTLTELYASESGSWSILVTFPGGLSCMVMSGENWDRADVPAGSSI